MSRSREQKKREQARRRPSAQPRLKPGAAPPSLSLQQWRAMADSTCSEARLETARLLGDEDRAGQVAPIASSARNIALRVIQRSPHHGEHECRAGCAFCCHTAVAVAPPEAMAIVAYLLQRCAADELADIRRRIETNAEAASRMSRLEYVAGNIRCALLTDDGQCRVHPVRPLACAGFLSKSRAACEAEFNRVPGRGEVPVDRYAMLAALSASHGLKEACQGAGVDGEFYELHHALRRLWNCPDAARAWATGETLFTECVRASAW